MTNWFCSGSEPIDHAGVHVNATLSGSVVVARWIIEAMGFIDAQTRRTWETDYATLSDDIKWTLQTVCSRLAAQDCIKFDSRGYISREADTLLNVNDEAITKGMAKLKDFKSNTLHTV